MPSKKPSAERIEQVKTQFQVLESKILESSQESGKEKHFRLLYDTALEAVDADLSKTAYRLWIYLSANYPFADREVDLPSQTEIGIRLGVTRQAINIAAAELQAMGLWDFWAERWKGRNLKGFGTPKEEGVEKNRQVSKKNDRCQKKMTRCQKKMTPCQKKMTPCQKKMTPTPLEFPSSNDSKIPHTSSNFKQTISHPLIQEGEEKKCFQGIRSNQLSFATFEAVMNHIAEAIATLKGKSSAAAPQTKLNFAKLQTDEPFADAKTLRRLSKVTGLSVESLRTNVGLQKAIESYSQNLEGVLDYLDAECKTFKPGIGFVVVALREGRSLANAGGAVFSEWIAEGEKRGLVAYSMSEGNDILIAFRLGKTRFNEPQYYSQIKGMSWDEIAL